MRTPAVGDWIRFMSGGRLVIDQIAYIVPRAPWDSTPEAMTLTHGCVRVEDIIERRQQAGE